MKTSVIVLLFVVLTAQLILGGQSAQLPPPSDMKTLGLIGGTSWYSTIEYYRYINEAVNDAYGNNTNPPLLLYNLNQRRIHELQAKNQWDDIAALLTEAAMRLRAGGAQAILFCANTPHKVYAQVARKTDIPILHIADATGVAIRKSGLKKVGLIGTLYTMEDGFIADWLKEHYGIDTLVPNSAPARQELHRIIQKELGMGIFKAESKKYVLQQIEALRQRGAQGIVLPRPIDRRSQYRSQCVSVFGALRCAVLRGWEVLEPAWILVIFAVLRFRARRRRLLKRA